MKKGAHTLEAGLSALLAKAKYHRQEVERYDRLAIAFREAEAALRSENGRPISDRPKNGKKRTILQEAIKEMPAEFVLSDLKTLVLNKGLKLHVFRRLFREELGRGVVVEKIKAMGRRPGTYVKSEQAANP
jgi:imidazoleglycerol phosphate dehydratase HisB